jgi:hypothetical protein
MFRSRRRAVIFPQAEHMRLAGMLAARWGNERFPRPPLDVLSFVKGVALHDRGYGDFDDHPLGAMSDETWIAITRRGFFMPEADAVADTVVKLHLQRLAGYSPDERRQALVREWEPIIAGQIARLGGSRDAFALADRITNLCDSIAFDFCFEEPARGEVEVGTSAVGYAPVRYEIAEGGVIRVEPWPFADPAVAGFIFAYAADGYPRTPQAILAPFSCVPAEK